MNYIGDFINEATVRVFFNTTKANGELVTLTGSPAIELYKNGSATPITAGVTLDVDINGRVGFNRVNIATTADGNAYAAANDYVVALSAGTVDGLSVAGYVVGTFSIQNRNDFSNVQLWNNFPVSSPINGLPQVELGGSALLLIQAK